MWAIQRYEFFIVSVTPGALQSAALPGGVITHNCQYVIVCLLESQLKQQSTRRTRCAEGDISCSLQLCLLPL